MADPMRDYITANREKYTWEAIREQLIAAGHDPAVVDAGWQQMQAADEPATAPQSRGLGPPSGRVRYVSVMWVLGGLITVLAWLTTVFLSIGAAFSTTRNPALAMLIVVASLIPLALYFLVGRLVAGRIKRSDALRRGNWLFLGCAIPAIFMALAFGSCLAEGVIPFLVTVR